VTKKAVTIWHQVYAIDFGLAKKFRDPRTHQVRGLTL
jgi:hypothetical protein